MKPRAVALLLLLSGFALADDAPAIKAMPRRPPEGSAIQVTQLEILPDCPAEKVCADGLVQNIGAKTAYAVRLKIEIGATKYGKPRTYFVSYLPDGEMAPGDTQDFSLQIDRKFPYKDEKKEDKVIEVGRYNFRVVPVWANAPVVPKRHRK